MSTRSSFGHKSDRMSRRLLRVPFVLLVAAFLALSVVLIVRQQMKPMTPEQLYHSVWQETQRNIYDPASLGDWKQWEHHFDGKLNTREEATKAIDEMLGSLHDQYTYFVAPAPATSAPQSAAGDGGPSASPVSDANSKHLPNGIGYVLLGSFGGPTAVDEFKSGLEELSDCRGIIVDLRSNRGGLIEKAIAIASMLLDKGTIVS